MIEKIFWIFVLIFFKLINGQENDQQLRCSRIFDSVLWNRIQMLSDEGLVQAKEDTSGIRPQVSLRVVRVNALREHCSIPLEGRINCAQNMCYHMMFRALDGSCNNFQQPLKGAAFTPLKRLNPSIYEDGIQKPISYNPNAREISKNVMRSEIVDQHPRFNAMMMQWGQILSHDIAKTARLAIDACQNCSHPASFCYNIQVDQNDESAQNYGCTRNENGGTDCCVVVARTSPMCGTSKDGSPREHYNENTAFIDASMIYGSSIEDSNRFRNGAFLEMENFNGNEMLPSFRQRCGGRLATTFNCFVNFVSGDDRVNLFAGLAAMHTIFSREHNRLVRELAKLNPRWGQDRLFQEARKIVGAEMQIITYKEWLPKLLGQNFDLKIGPYKGYDPNLDPQISNEFTTAALRFGHGMLSEFYERYNEFGQSISTISFDNTVFSSSKLVFNEGGIDPFMRGLILKRAKLPHRWTPAITERFRGNQDLGAINIQRGRDHGLPHYNSIREHCGFKRAKNFDDLGPEIVDLDSIQKLKLTYGDVDKIDLIVGLMHEKHVKDAMIGPTTMCLILEQFGRIREADRFWYENAGIFSDVQRLELDANVKLSRLFCDTMPTFKSVPLDAFNYVEFEKFTPCSQIPPLNLLAWRDTNQS